MNSPASNHPAAPPQSPPTAVGGIPGLLARLAPPPAWLVHPPHVAALGVALILLYLLVDLPLAVAARDVPQGVGDFFRVCTDIAHGSSNFTLGFVLMAVAAVRRSHRLFALGLYLVLAMAAAGLTVDLLKFVAGRHRPSMYFIAGDYGLTFFADSARQWSFPSGHAANAAVLATVLWYALPAGRVWWIVLAAILASSRVVVGAHFASDVIAGAYTGVLLTSSLRGWFPAALPPTIARGSGASPKQRPELRHSY